MNPLPAEFLAQLVARLQKKSPKFFRIIQRFAICLAVFSAVLWYVVNHLLPGLHIAVPDWLTFAQGEIASLVEFLLVGMGLGGGFVAKATLQTPDTPPVDAPKLFPNTPKST